jgi:hypothetical protein
MPDAFSVVIRHGSYHVPEPYQLFIAALKGDGVEAYCPQLPSSDLAKLNVGELSSPDYDRPLPPDGYPQPSDDVVVINELLTRLIVEGMLSFWVTHQVDLRPRLLRCLGSCQVTGIQKASQEESSEFFTSVVLSFQ